MDVMTVFVSGNFNVLHPGHLRLLKYARECGDKLVVAVNSDRLAGSSAHVPEALRLESLKTISFVDEAFINDEPVPELLKKLKPAIVVKGKEHENLENPEQIALTSYGGALRFCSGETTFSSLDLITKELTSTPFNPIVLPDAYMQRHDISRSSLRAVIDKFTTLKVCVIGDLIVDEYINCQPLGMSREDPTIVVVPVDNVKYIGGAGIVAAHAAKLGAQVRFVSLSGVDPTREFAMKQLNAAGVKSYLLADDSRPTTLKQRFRCQGKSLLRVSQLHQRAMSTVLQRQMLALVEDAMEDAQLLVFSDFNYGCLPQPLVEKITAMAKERGIFLAADSQSSSQVGDISRFMGVDLITPTEHEARLAVKDTDSGLVVLAENLRQQCMAKNILLTLGAEGVLIHAGDLSNPSWHTDRVDALNLAATDIAGAGDSLLIASALALAAGSDIWHATCLGSIAAAVQVGRVGNIPISAAELYDVLNNK